MRAVCASHDLRQSLNKEIPGGRVFHVHGLWLLPNVYPAGAGRRSGIPIVHSIRGMLGAEALKFSRQKKAIFDWLFQRRALASAACLHATSESEFEDIRAYGLSNPVAVIPNGIDLPDGAGTLTSSGTDKVVLSLGRIHPKKGLDRLIAAWAHVEHRFPDWRLRIAGPAELNHDNELRALIQNLRLQRVAVEGPIYGKEKWANYRSSDLFVLPTRHENFAMTVAEALAAGTPVISTKGAPWAGLEIERCGWWIDHGIESLAESLATAMSTPRDQLSAMGERGRAWMERDFSWAPIASKMAAVYRWVLVGGEPPPWVRLD